MEYIKCPACGNDVKRQKFCSECGFLLEHKEVKQEEPKQLGMGFDTSLLENVQPKVKNNTSVSDFGLTLLVNCCRKTIATVGGNGYSEYVLYKRDENEYELHFYSKYQYDNQETHFAYKASKEIVEEVYAYLKQANLTQYVGTGIGLFGGGDYIVKYLCDGKIQRISLSEIDSSHRNDLYKVEKIICQCATKENQLD